MEKLVNNVLCCAEGIISRCPSVDKDKQKGKSMLSLTVEVYPIIVSQYCHFEILVKMPGKVWDKDAKKLDLQIPEWESISVMT